MNQKLNTFLKGKSVIIIIGTVGSGKSHLAYQIDSDEIIEDVQFFNLDFKTMLSKRLSLLRRMMQCRHTNKRIVMTTSSRLHSSFLPHDRIANGIAYIFTDLYDCDLDYLSQFFIRNLLVKQHQRFSNTMKNHRKTRPCLAITTDYVHFGRFKKLSTKELKKIVDDKRYKSL